MSREWSIVDGPKCPSIARTECMARHGFADLWKLEQDLGNGRKLVAVVSTRTAGPTSGTVAVRFSQVGARREHAYAEAYRLLAQVYDTVGDIAEDDEHDPIDARPRITFDSADACVTCIGSGSMLAIAPFFGDAFCEEAF